MAAEQAPFQFVVELIAILFVVMMLFRHWRLNRRQELADLMNYHGLNEKDIVKIPEPIRNQWQSNGVTPNEFVRLYRAHVENNPA